MSDSPFQKVSSRTVYQNAWVQVEQQEVEIRATGRRFHYAFLSAPPSVMVVAITPEARVVLVRQYRYPSQEYAYELPGGGSGGLGLRRAAYKELREETGYAASRLRRLGEFVVYCGLSNEVYHVFWASGLRAVRSKKGQSGRAGLPIAHE